MNPVLIGNYIAEKRKSLGWTQKQLARQLSVTHQAVSRWEQGLALPDIETLVAMARLFGITVDRLLNPELKTVQSAPEPIFEDIEQEPIEPEEPEEPDESEPVDPADLEEPGEPDEPIEPEKKFREMHMKFERERRRLHKQFKKPYFTSSNFKTPDIRIPEIHIPSISIPEIRIPDFKMHNKYTQPPHVTPEKPNMREIINFQEETKENDQVKPVRSTEEIDEILDKLEDLAPFVSRDILSMKFMNIIKQAESINPDSLCDLAPFLSREALNSALDKIDISNMDTGFIEDMAPFIRGPKLAELVSKIEDKEWLINNFDTLAPFLPREYADRIFMDLF